MSGKKEIMKKYWPWGKINCQKAKKLFRGTESFDNKMTQFRF